MGACASAHASTVALENARKRKVLTVNGEAGWIAKTEDLQGMRVISTTACKLADLPKCVLQSSDTLRKLKLSNNLFTNLPAAAFANFTRLEELDLSRNRLGHLPDGLAIFPTNLRVLDLSMNVLVASDLKGGGQLQSLVQLNLAQNPGLASLDQLAFKELKSLEDLNVDGTSLHSLPEALSECPRLLVLSARDNQLESVPERILRDSPLLHTLNLDGNKGISEGKLIDMPGSDAYLQRRKARLDKQIAGGTFQPNLALT
jgi:Leucine-rich repeat (LRR) protein